MYGTLEMENAWELTLVMKVRSGIAMLTSKALDCSRDRQIEQSGSGISELELKFTASSTRQAFDLSGFLKEIK